MKHLACGWGTVAWDGTVASAILPSGRQILVVKSVTGIRDVQISSLPEHIVVLFADITKENLRLGPVSADMGLLWSLRSIDLCVLEAAKQ